MRQRDAEAREAGRKPRRLQKTVPLSAISKNLIHAVLSAEDPNFFGHEGIDWDAVKDSIETNIEKGRYARGGSTITQQLAKNLFYTTNKSLIRKAREAVVATWMERDLSKKRIIEIYLNVIEWGEARGGLGPERRGARVEVMARGGLGAEHALAPFDDVQVDLQDPALFHDMLDHDGDERLLPLAPGRALARQEEILRQLLRDGRAARDDAALLAVLLARFLDRFPVEALMIDETRVFRDHDRALQVRRDALVRHPRVAQLGLRVLLAQHLQALLHEGGGLGIVVAPPPDAREERKLHREEDSRGGQREPREDAEDPLHAKRARSSARTGPVSGARPRQRRNDSAACSTSMPRPSHARAPRERACSTKARAAGPYAMSYAKAWAASTWRGSSRLAPCVDVEVAFTTRS